MKSIISVEGVNLAYSQMGSSGRAVILMHGWGCTGETVKSIAQAICDRHIVYSIDLPGFGASSEPPAVWGSLEYCQCIESFAKALNITDPILIGHSFGGKISILFASRNSVNKVALVGSAGVKPKRSIKYFLKVYSYKAVKNVLPFLVGTKKSQQILSNYRSKAGSADYSSASEHMRSVLVKVVNEDVTSVMGSITAPVLLMWGAGDTATPVRDAKVMEKKIKNSGLVLFNGSGHYPFLDEPYAFKAVLNKFLD